LFSNSSSHQLLSYLKFPCCVATRNNVWECTYSLLRF
jgi:hypothetical protein